MRNRIAVEHEKHEDGLDRKGEVEGFYLQVIHKQSIPLSERRQTPHEGFHLQRMYINK